MKTDVIKLENFFQIKNKNGDDFFNESITHLAIPKYQREYKWNTNSIKTLFDDIFDSDKFLGIIALEEKPNRYEIIDGQQRITTLFLILIEIYNSLSDEYGNEENRDQRNIARYIKCDQSPNKYILLNETIGNCIKTEPNSVHIQISDNEDIYEQKKIFDKAIFTIQQRIIEKTDSIGDSLVKLRNKILDCTFLVFISESTSLTNSVESMYVDINDKRMKLDAEDIFKGKCFSIVDESSYDELKNKWVSLKQNAFKFRDLFNYTDFDKFLYNYFLSYYGAAISTKLEVKQKHIIENTTENRVFKLLNDMLDYSCKNIAFFNNVNCLSYNFEDICTDASNFRGTNLINCVKEMCIYILGTGKAQISKLPLLMFVQKISRYNNISFRYFYNVISNYYAYAIIFKYLYNEKSKQYLEISHINLINTTDFNNDEDLTNFRLSSKNLRLNNIESGNILYTNFNLENAYQYYSIFDNYNSNKGICENIYSRNNGYNDEHFIIHGNKTTKVIWKDGNTEYEIELYEYKHLKNKITNHLIVKIDLNENLLNSYDIVTKIQIIDSYYPTLPKHIAFFVNYIRSLDEYRDLKNAKNQQYSKKIIKQKYIKFIKRYFNEDTQNDITAQLHEKFVNAFRNN